MARNKKECAVFQPLKAKFTDFSTHNFYKINMNSSCIDHRSKSIDFIVANYEADAVHLYAFDTTISKSPAIV